MAVALPDSENLFVQRAVEGPAPLPRPKFCLLWVAECAPLCAVTSKPVLSKHAVANPNLRLRSILNCSALSQNGTYPLQLQPNFSGKTLRDHIRKKERKQDRKEQAPKAPEHGAPEGGSGRKAPRTQ